MAWKHRLPQLKVAGRLMLTAVGADNTRHSAAIGHVRLLRLHYRLIWRLMHFDHPRRPYYGKLMAVQQFFHGIVRLLNK